MAEAQAKAAAQKVITDSPEFQAAVASAVRAAASEAAAAAVEQFKNDMALATAKNTTDQGAHELMRTLAASIAELSDQGTSRKRVAPEILASRAQAFERLVVLVNDAREKHLQPRYVLMSKTYLNERFLEPFTVGPDKKPVRTEIMWTGIPNDAMRPINDEARAIFTEFRTWVGTGSDNIKRLDRRPNWITAGGLVVKGDPPQRRAVASDQDFKDDLATMNGNEDHTSPEIRVLGTVAPPARRQNAQQNPPGSGPA